MHETNFSLAATTTTGGQEFYSALQAQAQKAVGSIFTGTITPIQYPQQGDFLWYFLSPNQVLNSGTYDYITANVSPGLVPAAAQLSSSGGFANSYVQVISKIAYSLSSADLAAVNRQQGLANTQAQTLIADYQTTFGPITQGQLQLAQAALGFVPNLQDYIISYMMGYIWSGMAQQSKPPLTYTVMAGARNLRDLLPNAPASANVVITDASNYLSIMQPVVVIQSNQQQSSWILAQLRNNTQTPTTTNGGISTQNPYNGQLNPLNVAFGLGSASPASIQNDLNNTGRTISLEMTTSSASGNEINVSVQGQTGFRVGSWLQFAVSGGATYDMSKVVGTSASASVKMTWKGYSMVPISPLAWQQGNNTGWYYADPIAAAVKTGNQDVTNYKFVAPVSPVNLGPFSSGGNFGYLTNLLIANYPDISITYTNADFNSFQESWSENVSGNLSLFGWISLGGFSQGAYGSKYERGATNSTFTVTFSASPQVVSVPQMQQQAYVIGGAIANPGVTS